MPVRNELDRLAAAARPLYAHADALVDAGEEDAILRRIVATDRTTPYLAGRRRLTFALAAVLALAVVAAVAALETGSGNKSATGPKPHHHVDLAGAKIEVAGYRFRTPAGFTASDHSCPLVGGSLYLWTAPNGFASAAAADGGCVEAMVMMSPSPTVTIPVPAGQPVDVGSYHGYYNAQGTDVHGDSAATLYVELSRQAVSAYLVLFAHALSEDQLIAVALSGLPPNP